MLHYLDAILSPDFDPECKRGTWAATGEQTALTHTLGNLNKEDARATQATQTCNQMLHIISASEGSTVNTQYQ